MTSGVRHCVNKVFDGEGSYLRVWGDPGDDEGEFDSPRDICITSDDGGEVYVCDEINARVQVFDRQGTFLRQYDNDRCVQVFR